MSKKSSVVQLNNEFINDEHLRQRYEAEQTRQKNRFMGWVLIFIMLLFILPTYNLVKSYLILQERKQEVIKLRENYHSLSEKTKKQKQLANRLRDDAYVIKYARAKYYFSKTGEVIHPLPELLPK